MFLANNETVVIPKKKKNYEIVDGIYLEMIFPLSGSKVGKEKYKTICCHCQFYIFYGIVKSIWRNLFGIELEQR